MKISNINIKNKKLDFRNQVLELKDAGIYLIEGKNGCGKTSLIRKILFDSSLDFEFSDEKEKQVFESGKSGFFSYVPQKIPEYKISVRNFIAKGNENISKEKAENLMEEFGLSDISPDAGYESLSGGEKHKLSIISALLKEACCLILDEPSNHLDDRSVKILADIIEKYAAEHMVVLASHDPRIVLNNVNIIYIENNKILQVFSEAGCKPVYPGSGKSVSFYPRRFMFRMLSNLTNLISFILCLVLCMVMIFFDNYLYEYGYNSEEVKYPENTVLAYNADLYYEDLNQTFAKAANLKIDESLYDKNITKENIAELSEIDGITDIMIRDDQMLYDRLFEIDRGTAGDDIYLFNIPNEILNEYSETTGSYYYYFGNLIAGSYPENYAGSICISDEIAEEYFGFADNPEDWLGLEMEADGNVYTVCGITDNKYSLCLVSYDGINDYGYISIGQAACLPDDELTYDILIFTEEGMEEEVLKVLVETFPAENFISAVYAGMVKRQSNLEFILMKALPLNLLISLVLGAIIILIKNKQIQADAEYIEDYFNYYINRKQISRLYCLCFLVQFALVAAAAIIYSFLFSSYSLASWYVLLADALFMFVPSAIITFRKINKWQN